MDRHRMEGLLKAVGGGILLAAAVFGLLVVVNAERGFARCTTTVPYGWMFPLLAGLVIGVSTWILLGEQPRQSDVPSGVTAVACPNCGKSLMGEWRLCPYCGCQAAEVLVEEPTGALAASAED